VVLLNRGSVVKVFIVDDSAVIRRMVGALLAAFPDVLVVGEASSAEACFSPIEALAPDVVVMDWSMPGMSGIEATAELQRTRPDVRVVGFTSTDDSGVHAAFMAAGAAAVFAKEDAMALRDYLLSAAAVG
jgi:DNA-binding NarL/FixJ family response regulator